MEVKVGDKLVSIKNYDTYITAGKIYIVDRFSVIDSIFFVMSDSGFYTAFTYVGNFVTLKEHRRKKLEAISESGR